MTETLPLDGIPAAPPAGGPRYLVGPYTATPLLAVVVQGLPVAQGSLSVGKHGGMFHTNEAKLKPWRKAIAEEIEDACRAAGYRVPVRCADPVRVVATFTLARPASYPKTRRVLPFRKPDLDRLCRSLLDALTLSGVVVDDAQVVELRARKAFCGEHPMALPVPGVRFTVGVLA